MALVGKKAPSFNAPAVINGNEVVENFSLDQYLGKKYVVFFFYPKDFTFVCPTEIVAFQEKLKAFEALNTAVVGCSTDTENSHLAWLSMPGNKGGIQGVLAGDYDLDDQGSLIFKGAPIAYRGTFLIDKEGIVRHEVVNDFPLGRNIDEELRMVEALQHVEQYGEVCPADWNQKKKAIKATVESVSEYLAK